MTMEIYRTQSSANLFLGRQRQIEKWIFQQIIQKRNMPLLSVVIFHKHYWTPHEVWMCYKNKRKRSSLRVLLRCNLIWSCHAWENSTSLFASHEDWQHFFEMHCRFLIRMVFLSSLVFISCCVPLFTTYFYY